LLAHQTQKVVGVPLSVSLSWKIYLSKLFLFVHHIILL